MDVNAVFRSALDRRVGAGLWFDVRGSMPRDVTARHRFPRQTIRDNSGIAFHHSTGDPRRVTPAGTAQWHIQGRGWESIGYHVWIAWDGTVYQVGGLDTSRAHVRNRNDALVGVCFAGDWREVDPPARMLDAAARVVLALDDVHGKALPVKGHNDWAGGTACPGRIARFAPDIRRRASPPPTAPFDVRSFATSARSIPTHWGAGLLRAILADGFVPVGAEQRPDDDPSWVAQVAEHPATHEVRVYGWKDGSVKRWTVRRPQR